MKNFINYLRLQHLFKLQKDRSMNSVNATITSVHPYSELLIWSVSESSVAATPVILNKKLS